MLYISKVILDDLPVDIVGKLDKLSRDRQTMFECFYHRFSKSAKDNPVLPYMIMDAVQESILVE